MLVLQGSLEIQGAWMFDREISESIAISNPTFGLSSTGANGQETRLISARTSQSTFWTSLSANKYSTVVSPQNLFVAPQVTTIQTWLDYVMARDNNKPRPDSFNVEFNVSAAEGDSMNVNALWFLKGAALRHGFNGSSTTGGAIVNIRGPPSPPPLDLDRDCYLINRDVFLEMMGSLWPSFGPERHFLLLLIIDTLVDLSGEAPKLTQDWEQLAYLVNGILHENEIPVEEGVLTYVKTNFWRLFEFPLVLPALRVVRVGGTVRVRPLQDKTIPQVNFDLYRLSVSFAVGADGGNPQLYKQTWDDQGVMRQEDRVAFEFQYPHLVKHVWDTIVVTLLAFNGAEVWRGEYKPRDVKLLQLDIPVSAIRPSSLGPPAKGYLTQGDKKLRGTVVSLSKACTLKSTIVVQARQKSDDPWLTVCTGKSDKDGNFFLPYPYGQYVEAKALCSLNMSSSVPLSIVPKTETESISQDFIYILLQGETSDPGNKNDCNCNPGTVIDRLPSHDDLLQSNQFTQDVGGGCINLNVPNRTLREFGYTALVRYTDPDVANYQLKSLVVPPTEEAGVETTSFLLEAAGKVDRPVIDLDHPVQWEDDSKSTQQLYQAVTVSTGHVLHYKSEFKADGYSLGDLLYSLPLAPGQSKQIVTLEASHTFSGAQDEALSATDKLANSLLSDRTIIDQIAGNVGENLFGSSSATTAGVGAATGAAGTIGYFSGSIGVAGGISTASSKASQTSGRNMTQFFSERLRTSLQQNASSYRQQNATVVTSVQQGERYAATTEVVANHNHCHSMTVMYFEVLRHFAVFQELVDVEECVFVPLLMTKFGLENIARWSDTLAPRLLHMPSNTFMNTSGSWGRGHPLVPAFDAAERVRTNWRMVDYPAERYCDEIVTNAYGEFTLEAAFPRPNTRYDNILSLPRITTTVTTTQFNVGQAVDDVKDFIVRGFGVLGGKRTKDVGKVSKQVVVETNARIFDNFMRLDANYERVPPARCVRIYRFGSVDAPDVDGSAIRIDQREEFMNSADPNAGLWAVYAKLLLPKYLVNKPLRDEDKPTMSPLDTDSARIEAMMNFYFAGQLIGDWDAIWRKNVVPDLFEVLVDSIRSNVLSLDTTNLSGFSGTGQKSIRVAFSGTATFARRDITSINFFLTGLSPSELKELGRSAMLFNMRSLTIRYNTNHYNGIMFSGSVNGDIADETGVTVFTPLTEAEKRNPRREDRFLTERLITHLNHNLEYYNRVLWYSLDAQRRFLLLDGFKIQTFDRYGKAESFRSLCSVIKNELISIVGNSLVFPVAPGYHVSQAFLVADDVVNPDAMSESLLERYRTDSPASPYRISVPTRGVYSEAMLGQCDACERVKPESSQDWTRFTADQSTPFNAITAPVPAAATEYRPEVKDFATPMVQIQNTPPAPDPGIGLRGISELLGKPDIFKAITGLDANQRNAIDNYRANQQSATTMAQMASLTSMANQAHNTSNTSKIMDALSRSNQQGILSDDDHKALTKEHVQQMIDGGASRTAQLAEQETKVKQGAVEKAIQSGVDRNRDLKYTRSDRDGSFQDLSLGPGPGGGGGGDLNPGDTQSEATVSWASVDGILQPIQQPPGQNCWAALLAMMISWKIHEPMTVKDAVAIAGGDFVKCLTKGKGLDPSLGDELLQSVGLVSEPGASNKPMAFVTLMKQYGPLWLTLDASPGLSWSPHAVFVHALEGQGRDVIFHVCDPATGKDGEMKFEQVRQALEEVVTDSSSRSTGVDDLVQLQIIHWPDKPGKINSNIGYSGGDKLEWYFRPVHESITYFAMRKSKSGLSPDDEKSPPTLEIMRGIFFNDDPESLMFDLSERQNFNKAFGLEFAMQFYNISKLFRCFEFPIKLPDYRATHPENFNMTRRSHFGDLQFLHSMASSLGESPLETSVKVLLWVEIMYNLSIGANGLTKDTKIGSVAISRHQLRLDSFFRKDTGPSNSQTLSELLAPNERFRDLDLPRRALGSVLHVVQDSYAKGHAERQMTTENDGLVKLGKIVRFHVYGAGESQDNHKYHDGVDADFNVESEDELTENLWGTRDAIAQSTRVIDFWSATTPWESGVRQWAEEVFVPAANAKVANYFTGE